MERFIRKTTENEPINTRIFSKIMEEIAEEQLDEFKIDEKSIREWIFEIKEYREKKKQGKIIELPCKPGDTVYIIQKRYTKCQYGQEFDESSCCGCEAEECDSKKEYYIFPMKSFLVWIVSNLERFGKTVFLTEQEAKEALEGMKHV